MQSRRIFAELGRLRQYLVFGRKDRSAGCDKLMRAIDDYVEEMTGDRTKLRAGFEYRRVTSQSETAIHYSST
jgi:hypothetical protein